MAQIGEQHSDRNAAHRARWEAVRPHVMRQRWFDHIIDLETSIDTLEKTLAPNHSHVARLKRTPAETRAALEAALAEVEKICRHMRMEHQHDGERDMQVVTPLLAKLEQAPCIRDDLKARGLQDTGFASTKRMEAVDNIRQVLHEYAGTLGSQVTRDTLYNAYRQDFHGMAKEKFEAHPFVDHLKETSDQLRMLALGRNMQRLARRLKEDSDPVITDAATRFVKQLNGMHTMYDPRLREWLDCLSDANSTALDRAAAKTQAGPWLQEKADYIIAHVDRKHLLSAFEHDQAVFLKPRSATPPTKSDLYQLTGVARESLTQLSYLRTESTLNRLSDILRDHWREVEQLYPHPQQPQHGGRA